MALTVLEVSIRDDLAPDDVENIKARFQRVLGGTYGISATIRNVSPGWCQCGQPRCPVHVVGR